MTQNDWMNLLLSAQAPANVTKPDGIIFDDVVFTEPAPFAFFLPPFGHAGLYAIIVPDVSARPRTYRAIYFGQASKLSERVRESHEKYEDWVKEAGGAWRLYVSFRTMSATENERVATERRLIEKYQPACNDMFNPLRALFGGFECI